LNLTPFDVEQVVQEWRRKAGPSGD
jgi:hypothetical protein